MMDELVIRLIEQAPTVGVLVLIVMWQARQNSVLTSVLVELIRRCDCDETPSP